MSPYELKFNSKPLYPATDEATVSAFERKLGTSLPSDYREFLFQWNGVNFSGCGNASNCVFLVWFSEPLPTIPRSVAGISREELEELDASILPICVLHGFTDTQGYELDRDRENDAFFLAPKRFFPIGSNEMGDQICISLGGPDRGHIFYWTRPDELPEEKANYPPMAFLDWVAPSFHAFWDVVSVLSWDEQEELEG